MLVLSRLNVLFVWRRGWTGKGGRVIIQPIPDVHQPGGGVHTCPGGRCQGQPAEVAPSEITSPADLHQAALVQHPRRGQGVLLPESVTEP